MATVEELAKKLFDDKKTGIAWEKIGDDARAEFRQQAHAAKQSQELLDLLCQESGQDPEEVLAVVGALRKQGCLQGLPPLAGEE